MKVLFVVAHPEPKSLNWSLLKVAAQELEKLGHEVKISDLYGSKWQAVVGREDFLNLDTNERLKVAVASASAFSSESLTEDVKAEQDKLLWADTVIFQFPLWWYSMPAILKGWIDRVYAYGFAYGVGEHNDRHWGDRYGEGIFQGKRAMLIVTAGGWKTHYSERGVNGSINDILFPINHGILYYPGFDVLPSFVVYEADRMKESEFELEAEKLRERMRTLSTIAPIPYRKQNDGDYSIPNLELRVGLERQGTSGFDLHLKDK